MSESKPAWKTREESRFADGTYKPIPQIGLNVTWIADHYLHLSVKGEADMIAYTPNASKGEADRQVSMKFGRYLKQYYSLDDTTVHNAVVALRAALGAAATENDFPKLKFATDRDTINRIFETALSACNSGGMISCMHGKFESWSDRPYHVYADSPDVAIAYLESDREVYARSVVSTKYKRYVRLYAVDGCETKCHVLKDALVAAGYEHGDLDGNRLTRLLRRGRKEVLPYLDGDSQYVRSDGSKYWIVTDSRNGEYECTNTDGTADECGDRCDCCEELMENCECYVCECCGERSTDGCDNCRMCEECDGCVDHNGCSCSRCEECGEIISPRYRYTTACDCDRCSECGELEDNCECEKCEECNELVENCTCEPETESDTDSEPEPTPRVRSYLFVVNGEGNTYTKLPVFASVRFAGHTFLVHKSLRGECFNITYAPLGLSGGSGDTVQAAIDGLLARDTDMIRGAVERGINNARENYLPLLSAEEGVTCSS